MPRTRQEIIDHADELARQFEEYEPKPEDDLAIAPLYALRAAAIARSNTEKQTIEAVAMARESGYSWAIIGAELGTSGEAARQRYGKVRAK